MSAKYNFIFYPSDNHNGNNGPKHQAGHLEIWEGGKISGTTGDNAKIVGGRVLKVIPAEGGDSYQADKEQPDTKKVNKYAKTNPGIFTILGCWRNSTDAWANAVVEWQGKVFIRVRDKAVFKSLKDKVPLFYLGVTDGVDELTWFASNAKIIYSNTEEFIETTNYANPFGHYTMFLKGTDQCVHPTPQDEAALRLDPKATIELSYSHGCIHIRPDHIDELCKYATNNKSKIIIRSYPNCCQSN